MNHNLYYTHTTYSFIIFSTILFFLASLSSLSGFASLGWQRSVVNFDHSKDKVGFQTWMITQAENGWIYAANNNGLLEFDGVSWTLHHVPNGVVRSVQIIDGKIYVGGSAEFGYFEPDSAGRLTYQSLSEKPGGRCGQVRNILNGKAKIYFVSDRHIYIYRKATGDISTVEANRAIYCSAFDGNRLYVGAPYGIWHLDDADTLALLPPSAQLRNSRITRLLPYENKMLVSVAWKGLYFVDEKSITPISTASDGFSVGDYTAALGLSGSRVLLGSVQHGACVVDLKNPSVREDLDLGNGPRSNHALCSFFDKNQNLWLGFDKGISYVNLTGPLRPLFAGSSPVGTGCYSALYNNALYLGAVHGLYRLDRSGALSEVPQSGGQVGHMATVGDDLLCAGSTGITAISPAGAYKIDLPEALEVHPLPHNKNKLIVCTYSGFHVLEKESGRWRLSHPIPDFWGNTHGLLEDDESGSFWLVGSGRQVQKLTFDHEATRIAEIKKYDLPCSGFGSNIFMRRVGNSIVICAKDGIYRYCRLTDCFERYTHLEAMLEGAKYYEYLDVDAMKNIWFISDNQLKELPFEHGAYQKNVNTWGLDNMLVGSYEHVLPVDSATVVVAVNNAFVKIDKSKSCAIPAVKPHIRKLVSSKNDSVICYGKASSPVVLPYSLNSIRIYLAAAAPPLCPQVMYSCRLNGQDDEWSLPSPNPVKEYANLHEGRYVFEVKTVVAGQASNGDIASIEIKIRPPWFRSTFAYIIYAGGIAALLLLLRKKAIRKKNHAIRQNRELIPQSSGYKAAPNTKGREIYELHSKHLQAELDFKRQELTGYALNLKRKNEILLEVKQKAMNIATSLDERRETATLKRKIQQLISQVNANIENDSGFEVFESNFNLIHQSFFKLLDEKFPQLSKSDKILCAYLKMNLSSKEIAPLQSISVRGVEVNRYRLRKKMNLSREVNLSDYLQNLGSEYEC
ncbi:MAG: hypothetical protein LBK18_00480 [Prevotellaceae bacterium]|jgi:DNA-binding CsgD family transcriptional regulator|nr:hypothetical protein [Prevotellaceae bacterium]